MMNVIAIILFAAAAYAGWEYALPAWEDIKIHRAEIAQIENIEAQSREIATRRDEILERYNAVTTEEVDRLEAMVPELSDQEDLYLFFQKIISDSGMTFDGVTLSDAANPRSRSSEQSSISFSMDVKGEYGNVRFLLDTLENNLRIIDVTSINFGQAADGDFTLTITGNLYYGS